MATKVNILYFPLDFPEQYKPYYVDKFEQWGHHAHDTSPGLLSLPKKIVTNIQQLDYLASAGLIANFVYVPWHHLTDGINRNIENSVWGNPLHRGHTMYMGGGPCNGLWDDKKTFMFNKMLAEIYTGRKSAL